MNAERARIANDVARVPSDPDCKLLERCPVCKHELEPGALLQLPLRVVGESEAGLPHVAQPLRPEPREIDEAAEGEERLVVVMFDVAFSRRMCCSRVCR